MDTAAGNPVDNEQVQEISSFEESQFRRSLTRFPYAQLRSRPNPLYNCHGLAFGSRRTGVFDPPEIQKIIKDDGYDEVPMSDAKPGDVILYFAEDGDIEHSALVFGAATSGNLNIPMVISKWGKGGEFLHPANHCPYSFLSARCFRVSR